MNYIRVRLPFIHEWFKCELCHKTWGVAYHYIEAIYNRKRIEQELALVETDWAIHNAECKLSKIVEVLS